MKEPKATNKQIELLNKYEIKFHPEITVKEASILISAYNRTFRIQRKADGISSVSHKLWSRSKNVF